VNINRIGSSVFVVVFIFLLQGCSTLKGLEGEDKGIKKVSHGVEEDIHTVGEKILELDEKMRESYW